MERRPPPIAQTVQDDPLDIAVNKAHRKIIALVEKNGCPAEDVKITKNAVRINAADISCTCRLVVEHKETISAGSHPTGVEIDGATDLARAIEQHKALLLRSDDFIETLKHLAQTHDFGLTGAQAPLIKSAQKAFWYLQPCNTCSGNGKSACATCNGLAEQPCIQCQGQGEQHCLSCKGVGKLQHPNGSEIPCNECHSTGKATCRICSGRKTTPCKSCHAEGYIVCQTCNQSGTKTVITIVNIKADFKSDVNWKSPPPEDLKRQFHDKQIFIHPDVTPTSTAKVIRWTFKASLPQGYLNVRFKDDIKAQFTVTGTDGMVKTNDLFLDDLIKPGLGALSKIARTKRPNLKLFRKARQFAVIRDVTNRTTYAPAKKIYNYTRSKYSTGLSDKYATALVKLAERSIDKVTTHPRKVATAATVGLFAFFFFIWFIVGMRPNFLNATGTTLQFIFDGLFFAGFSWAAHFINRKALHMQLMKIWGSIPKRLPKSGAFGIILSLSLFILYLIFAALSPADPAWIS